MIAGVVYWKYYSSPTFSFVSMYQDRTLTIYKTRTLRSPRHTSSLEGHMATFIEDDKVCSSYDDKIVQVDSKDKLKSLEKLNCSISAVVFKTDDPPSRSSSPLSDSSIFSLIQDSEIEKPPIILLVSNETNPLPFNSNTIVKIDFDEIGIETENFHVNCEGKCTR